MRLRDVKVGMRVSRFGDVRVVEEVDKARQFAVKFKGVPGHYSHLDLRPVQYAAPTKKAPEVGTWQWAKSEGEKSFWTKFEPSDAALAGGPVWFDGKSWRDQRGPGSHCVPGAWTGWHMVGSAEQPKPHPHIVPFSSDIHDAIAAMERVKIKAEIEIGRLKALLESPQPGA